jgi:hypothetical protein
MQGSSRLSSTVKVQLRGHQLVSAASPGNRMATRPSAWASIHLGSLGSRPVSRRTSGALTYLAKALVPACAVAAGAEWCISTGGIGSGLCVRSSRATGRGVSRPHASLRSVSATCGQRIAVGVLIISRRNDATMRIYQAEHDVPGGRSGAQWKSLAGGRRRRRPQPHRRSQAQRRGPRRNRRRLCA